MAASSGAAQASEAAPEPTTTVSTIAIPALAAPQPHWAEVDLTRHVLVKHLGDQSLETMPISTGDGQRYKDEFDHWYVATTPVGDFRVVYQGPAGDGGDMPWPSYFAPGGVAIHGGNVSAPTLSHGCVRVPRDKAEMLYHWLNPGDRVWVHQ